MPGSARRSDIGVITGVEVIDDHTVKLVLSAPFVPLLAQLAFNAGAMMSPKAAQAAGENFGSHPVCSGPFRFAERVAQDRIVLERFADYWGKDKIKLDRIIYYLPMPDPTVRLWNWQSGELQGVLRAAAGGDRPVWGLAFSLDERRLAIGRHDGCNFQRWSMFDVGHHAQDERDELRLERQVGPLRIVWESRQEQPAVAEAALHQGRRAVGELGQQLVQGLEGRP